jgi:hypothetical protein
MVRFVKSTGAAIAAVSGAVLLSTAVIVLSATMVGEKLIALQTAKAEPRQELVQVNRERKGDALPVPVNTQDRSEIKTVEVIGVRDASIVYRDRGGNILFQTDPLANVTVVTKNVDLPEVTIRETETTKVERVPAENIGSATPPKGCESAFARPAPESLTRTSSRCVT